MQLFSGWSKPQQNSGRGGGGKDVAAASTAAAVRHRNNGKCRALCCGASRLSVSSSASWSSADAPPPPPTPPRPRGLSNLAHGMVQARLQSMIDDAAGRSSARRGSESDDGQPAERRRRRPCNCSCACGGGGYHEKTTARAARCERRPFVVLVAVDRTTYAPREEFRRSIAEVVAAKRMAEPAELRALLNCYVSVNAREHRAAILEAFHEVCSGLFASCKG